MKRLFIVLFIVVVIIGKVEASDYALPYPSYMPGHKLYNVSYFLDFLKQYWHWGTLASITYRMSLADKNLVEAKTLFEYKQYLLAINALQRSNSNIGFLIPLIVKARGEGKDIRQMVMQITSEMDRHVAILDSVARSVPDTFLWQPEKLPATKLDLSKDIIEAIAIRDQVKNFLPSN